MKPLLKKFGHLFWPPPPDPNKSRQIAETRLLVSCFIAFALIIGIAARIIQLAESKNSFLVAENPDVLSTKRGRILDRDGQLLAGNLPITMLHADPSEIMDINEAVEKLVPLLDDHNEASLRALLAKPTRYVELDRKLTPKLHASILRLGIPGIYFTDSAIRIYPRHRTASHILGNVDTENNGIAGIEKSMNHILSSGQDVFLSIDLGVQAVLKREIQRQIDNFEAIGGAGVILDIDSGETIALASLPDFNPNQFAKSAVDARFNRATKGLYEMGSTFKVLNTAIALETGAVQIQQRFEVSKPLHISRFKISDFHPHTRPLNVPEILVYSSNIGSALIAEAIGAKTQRAYIEKLGLLDRLELELPEISRPLSPKHWHQTTTATVSYGHGISVSPLHLASAVAAASGNGQWIHPTLLKRPIGDEPLRMRVFSAKTAQTVRSMMRLVVSHKDGTGNFADAPGYLVGGKTGTSEKVGIGGYDKKANIATFAATFPVHEPRYVLVILVDEPQGQKHSYGYATAGWVVAPAVRRIVEQIAPLLGVLPVDEQSPSIRQKLTLDFKIGNEEATLASY